MQAGQQAGLPGTALPFWAAIIQQESGGSFDAYANSDGAVGPAQVLHYPLPSAGENLDTWAQANLLAGAQMFKSDLASFGGNIEQGIAAYYTGVGNVQQYGISDSYGNPTPKAYVASVERIAAGEPGSLSYPVGATPQTEPPGTTGAVGGMPPVQTSGFGTNVIKQALCLGCDLPFLGDTVVCKACRAEASAIASAVTAPVSIAHALGFLFSYRFLEIVGGGLLVLVGLYLLARQVGVAPGPTTIVQGAVRGVAGV